MDRMEEIRHHFEEEAAGYDGIIIGLIPYYEEMMEAVASSLPFDQDDSIHILDLGCGTGSLSHRVRSRFPRAVFTLVDISERMLTLAGHKLGEDAVKASYCTDFSRFIPPEQYDGIISSLALHHLERDDEKKDFFARIRPAIKGGGVFLNADVVLADDERLQEAYMEKWISYMRRSLPLEEIHENWLAKYRREDRPAPLAKQLDWLKEAGFDPVETVWKYYNFAVYGGFPGNEGMLSNE